MSPNMPVFSLIILMQMSDSWAAFFMSNWFFMSSPCTSANESLFLTCENEKDNLYALLHVCLIGSMLGWFLLQWVLK